MGSVPTAMYFAAEERIWIILFKSHSRSGRRVHSIELWLLTCGRIPQSQTMRLASICIRRAAGASAAPLESPLLF